MGAAGHAVFQFLELLVVPGVLVYAFMLMFLGPTRAGRAMSSLIGSIGFGLGRLVAHLGKIIIMTVINTAILIARLAVSAGRPDQVTEAWSKYVERMADVVLGA